MALRRTNSAHLHRRSCANPSPQRVGVSRFASSFRHRRAPFGFLSGGQWNVALKVHSVVEDAYDFDRAVWRYSIHQDLACTATLPRNVERPMTRYDLVSSLRARDTAPSASSPIALTMVLRQTRDCRAPKFSLIHLRIFAKSSSAAAPS
jgi:hypothetical protein